MPKTLSPLPGARCVYLSDLLERLGNVPASRIRLDPPPGHATAKDILAIDAHEDRFCELIDGTLVEKVGTFFEALLNGSLIYFLHRYLEDRDLGVVLGSGGMLQIFPGQIRIPDVSFIAWSSMPKQRLPREAIWSLAPDLAIEILGPDNTDGELRRKVEEYFQASGKLVWIVDPVARTVRVHTSPRRSTLLTEDDTLDGRKVLPGFSLPIRKWFARASRQPRR